jgi:N-acetylglucosamine malate deacetylase 1
MKRRSLPRKHLFGADMIRYWRMATDSLLQLDVLAIGAHPDDVELSAGGTLINLARQGYRTGVLDLTRGEAGTRGTPEIRAAESRQAAAAMGIIVRENLDLGDTHIWANEESRVKLVRALRRLRPRVVFTQYWDDPHPDHAHASQLVREAAHVAGLVNYDAGAGQERWRPAAVAYFLFPRGVAPTFIVDISEARERKWEAIRAHASQFHNPRSTQPQSRVSTEAFLREMDARDRYFGALIGAEYGEAFFVREVLNVPDPVALLTQPMNLYS